MKRICKECGKETDRYIFGVCVDCIRAEQGYAGGFTLNYHADLLGLKPLGKDYCEHVVAGKWPNSYKLKAAMELSDDCGHGYIMCFECLEESMKEVEEAHENLHAT